jgi:hypothetical protein
VPPYATYENNDTTLDTPISELNNHTLREVFEDNKVNTLSNWVGDDSTITYAVDEVKLTSSIDNNLYPSMRCNEISTIIDDNYYVRLDALKHSTLDGDIRLRLHFSPYTSVASINTPISDTWYSLSAIYSTSVAGRWRIDHELDTGEYIKVKNIYNINLDILGISPTTDMDYYYSLYQELLDLDGATISYLDYDLHDIALIIFFGFLWLSLIILLKRKVLI